MIEMAELLTGDLVYLADVITGERRSIPEKTEGKADGIEEAAELSREENKGIADGRGLPDRHNVLASCGGLQLEHPVFETHAYGVCDRNGVYEQALRSVRH